MESNMLMEQAKIFLISVILHPSYNEKKFGIEPIFILKPEYVLAYSKQEAENIALNKCSYKDVDPRVEVVVSEVDNSIVPGKKIQTVLVGYGRNGTVNSDVSMHTLTSS